LDSRIHSAHPCLNPYSIIGKSHLIQHSAVIDIAIAPVRFNSREVNELETKGGYLINPYIYHRLQQTVTDTPLIQSITARSGI